MSRVWGLIFILIVCRPSASNAGVRWINPAGSPYVDAPDGPEARGSFVLDGRLFTLLLEDGKFSVASWHGAGNDWRPWSHPGEGQPAANGEIDHVSVETPGLIVP